MSALAQTVRASACLSRRVSSDFDLSRRFAIQRQAAHHERNEKISRSLTLSVVGTCQSLEGLASQTVYSAGQGVGHYADFWRKAKS